MLNIQTNRFLSEVSTFGIGGPIRFFAEVASPEEAEEAYAWARSKKLSVLVVGKGSNCLFRDELFEGLVLLNKIDFCTINDVEVSVGSGFSFSLLGVQTAKRNLSGLEFASGIPATVGGAIFMNAGANGKETFESLHSVSYLYESGERREFQKEELFSGYRTSCFQAMKGFILSACFRLAPKEEARKSQLDIIQYRLKTQPYKEKSAGCVFRNPSREISAGALIEKCGLKGFSIGSAKVSELHANFFINRGNATAQEMIELIERVQRKVFEKTGIHLEREIRVIP
ncbi:MAG TPA: UDP-N-acetylmuramate dehydrogenase [Chlamydiales bacterium]|nr:UDP-N-acetylmuramate dehydrogenase [Chlamydiales bacterium]